MHEKHFYFLLLPHYLNVIGQNNSKIYKENIFYLHKIVFFNFRQNLSYIQYISQIRVLSWINDFNEKVSLKCELFSVQHWGCLTSICITLNSLCTQNGQTIFEILIKVSIKKMFIQKMLFNINLYALYKINDEKEISFCAFR